MRLNGSVIRYSGSPALSLSCSLFNCSRLASFRINHAARNALNKPIRELISLRTLLKYSLSFASFMANQKLDNKRQECRLSNRKLFSTFYTEHSSIFSYLKINDFIGR